jgi:putative addiction module killer protein
MQKKILIYQASLGKAPFREWLLSKKLDPKTRAKIRAKIELLSLGNYGNCKSVGAGVYELKIDYGPGYRVYFGQKGDEIIILLCGGDKSTQPKDIKTAQLLWKTFEK